MSELEIARFAPGDQGAVRALILEGLAEHWGTLDPSLNPDLGGAFGRDAWFRLEVGVG
ncbi:MAG TPA: hypothetical protein VGN59_16840 [Acidimicrobiia bacterium]